MRTITRLVIASALTIAVGRIETSTARPPGDDRTYLPRREAVAPPAEAGRRDPHQNLVAAQTLGPMPRLEPIVRFLPPIEPWVQSGLGWADPVTNEIGEPVCATNRFPRRSCDPAGPRPFAHAGFDAMPAFDRSVKASAAGRVVYARASFALVAGGRDEAGGVVLVEHDLDGDPGTPDDRLVTIYGHVEPLVKIGAIVRQGDLIARSSRIQGEFLHFGVRRAAFDPTSPDVFRSSLPPEGTIDCLPCYGRPLPLPAFPERWEDPETLLRGTSYWAELLEGGAEGGGAVVETPDGFLVGGWTRPAAIEGFHDTDMWLVKLDPDGNIRSQDSYDGSSNEEISRLLPARDGGYVALARSAGSSGNSPLLVKFDAAAETIEWQTKYVASGSEWGNDLRATSDGGYVIAGASNTCCGERAATIMKLDSEGSVQWAKWYRSPFFDLPSTDAISIVETSNGDFVVAGTVSPGDLGTMALLVFRVDPTGKLIWSSEIRAYDHNVPGQIEATPDGGFAIVGTKSFDSFSYPITLWFMKLRGDGSLERENYYGTFSAGTGTRLALMLDGGYVLAGRIFDNEFKRSDPWVLRLDASGQILEQRAFDGRSGFDDVTGLIPTRDGGFIITGGQDLSCSQCVPGHQEPANFLVVKMNPDLEVTPGCQKETQAYAANTVSITAQEPLVEEALPVVALPTNLTKTETAARAYACHEAAYGPPPVFQSASVQMNERLVACDFTHVLEGLLCGFGVPGAEAIEPVVISGSYDHLQIETHVTDLDSTPELNDVAEVHAELTQPGLLRPLPVPLVDDGSSEIVLEAQRSNIAEDCFEDPIHGTCVCTPARYPTASGDVVLGDSVYSHGDALWSRTSPSLLVDCAMKSDHYDPLAVFPASSLGVSIKASDRIGNISVWPEPIHLTTGISTFACSGDPCGCCYLRYQSLLVPLSACFGLEGLPSPTFPCGLCKAFPELSCPP